MRHLLLVIVTSFIFTCLFGQGFNFHQRIQQRGDEPLAKISHEIESIYDTIVYKRGNGYKQFRRWQYLEELNRGYDDRPRRLIDMKRPIDRKSRSNGASSNYVWTEVGPYNDITTRSGEINIGRIMSLSIGSSTDMLLISTDGGGLWVSTNGGSSWSMLNGNLPTLDLSYAVFAPSNHDIIYTAENNRLKNGAVGLYQSIDGGLTFTLKNSNTLQGIRKIVVHSTDVNKLWLCCENGLFYSSDGGSTCTLIAGSTLEAVPDLEFHPTNSNICYASSTKKFYKSTNGGVSFSAIQGITFSNYTRIATLASQPNLVWVLTKEGNSKIYKSTDAGSTFPTANVETITTDIVGYMPYRNLALAIHPGFPSVWYAGGVDLYRWSKALNPTRDYTLVSKVHADISEMKFAGNTLYVVSDGGICKITDNNTTIFPQVSGFTSLNNNLPIKQIYKMSVSKGSAERILFGCQDNGSSYFNGTSWEIVSGGDGGDCVIHPEDHSKYYSSVCINKGISSNIPGFVAPVIEETKTAFVYPVEIDASNPSVLYYAGQQVWRQESPTSAWQQVTNIDWQPSSYLYTYIDLVKVAPSNSNIIYFVNNVTRNTSFVSSTSIYRSVDRGSQWTKLSLPVSVKDISDIAIHPTLPLQISFISRGENKVFESSNGGDSWSEVTTGFGRNNLYAIVYDGHANHGKYISSLGSVYYSNNHLTTSIDMTGNLPNVQYTDIEINPTLKKLYIASYGRGIWKIDLIEPQSYRITFNANGGIGNMAEQSFEEGVAQNLSSNTFTRTGYSFTGWNSAANGSGSSYSNRQTITLIGNLTLYAQWRAEPGYTVTFNANGGIGNMAEQSFEEGVAQNLSSNTFTRTGYSFTGWNSAANGSGSSYSNRQAITLTANLTLYAQWKARTYSLTFNAGGGVVIPTSKSVTYNAAIGVLPTPGKEGYSFMGWKIGTTTITTSSTWRYTANQSAVAQWRNESYILTLDPAGGKVSPTSKSVTYGVAIGVLPTPGKEGYSFVGWKIGTTDIRPTTLWSYLTNQTATSQWEDLQTGISKDSTSLKVYPNPVKKVLTIDNIALLSGRRVVIFDISGKEVLNVEISEVIDVSKLGQGVYTLKVGNYTARFIKIKD